MCTRRDVLCSGLFALAACAAGPRRILVAQQAKRTQRHGCTLSSGEATRLMNRATEQRWNETGREPVIPNSGDPDFDFALAQTLAKLSDEFDVLPGFAYYDDYDDPQAFATDVVRLRNADGTVLFGKNLLKQLLASPENPDVAVAAVCAHEFGHILQYKRHLIDRVNAGQSTQKRVELQADFFAGFFSGIRKRERPEFPAAVFALTQFNFGDAHVSSPSHHGTNEERGAAIERGFMASYRDQLRLDQAIDVSIAYVTKL